MKLTVCAVYDRKMEMYMNPIFTANRAVAVRAFSDECLSEESVFWKHPEDYVLEYIGTFDQEKGVFENGGLTTLMEAAEARRV